MDVNFLERYIQDHPDSLMFARLADAYLDVKRVDDAIQLCEDGIKKHPYYATGHFILAKGYMANSLFEQAEKEFKRVLLFDPKYLGAHKLYGDLMREIGWENTYQLSYKKIMQFDPLEDVAKDVVTEALERTEEHDATKDLSEFSLASSENVTPAPKNLDEQENDWSKGSDLPDKSDWPEEPNLSGKSGSVEEAGFADETTGPDTLGSSPIEEPSDSTETKLNALKDEPVFTPAPDFKPEPEPFKEDEDQQDIGENAVDLEAISPMAVTEEEEDLVFGDEVSPETDSKSKPELSAPETTVTPEHDSSGIVTEVDEEELGEKEAEEFSYILEDIFKDEGVEDKSATQNIQEQVSPEEAKSALDREADNFMQDFKELDKETKNAPEIEKQNEAAKDDFPDFSKASQDEYDLTTPAKPDLTTAPEPEFTPPPPLSPTPQGLSKDDDIESEDEPLKQSPSAAKNKSDKIVTPTLGEIYAAQGQYAKAIDVFAGLLKKHPDNESYNNKIEVLKKKLEEAGDD